MKQSTSEFLDVRGRRIHVRLWGDEAAPLLVLLHGWGDVSGSWQFVVDEFQRDWRVVAPDWRGFGQSEWHGEPYFTPSYLADLDAVLDRYSPDQAVQVVGHSMGANMVSIYAGVFPERVARIVNLEGVGMPRTVPEQAPDRYGEWIRMQKQVPGFRHYANRAELAERLQKDNPRLTAQRAEFLSRHFGLDDGQGGIRVAIDPTHRLKSPVLYRIEEAMACWRRVAAPVLLVMGKDSVILRHDFFGMEDEFRVRRAAFPDLREVWLAECGHNVHHDQPEALAGLIDEFMA